MIRLQTLGSLDLRAADGPSLYQILRQPKRLALLAYLAIEKPGAFHRRDHLLGLFWPEADERGGRASLSQAVHFLRQALGKDVIVNRGDEEIGLAADQLWCDAANFQHLVSEKRFGEAIGLYQGELLPSFFVDEATGFEQWLEQKRGDLQRAAMRAATALADAAETKADYDDVVLWLRRAINYFPYDETLHRRLIAALDGAGDRAAALRAYDDLVQILRTEFDAEPSAETRSLIDAVRARSEAQSLPQLSATPMNGAARFPATLARRPRRRLIATSVVMVLIASALLWGSAAFREPQPGAPVNRIAVLFFNDATPNNELAHIAEGLTTSLIDQLGQIRQLEVISQNGVRPFRGDSIPLDSIARQLDVGTIVGGSVSSSGDVLRVTVEMIKGASGIVARTRTFERPTGELFALLDDVTREVGSFLRVSVGEEVKLQAYRSETQSVQAWQAVQRADQLLSDADSAADAAQAAIATGLFVRADSLLELAARLDEKWPTPLVLRARSHEMRAWLALVGRESGPREHLGVALQATEDALRRDRRSAAAYEARGRIRYVQWLLFEFSTPGAQRLLADAERDLTLALDLDPERARAESTLSLLYESLGRFEDARNAAARALRADAYLEEANQVVIRLFQASFEVGDDTEAGYWCDEVRRRMAGHWPEAYCDLLLLAWSKNATPDARKALHILENFGQQDRAELRAAMRPRLAILAASVVARSGDIKRAEQMLGEARRGAPHDPELLQFEAALRVQLADYENARRLLLEYLKRNPTARPRLEQSRIFKPLHAQLFTRAAAKLAN
jgi:DNA-binding SARP family transcriptional activator/TolB-like protein/Flp pilus assembly protein TadD